MNISPIFFPLLIPLFAAILCLGSWKRVKVQQAIYLVGALLTLAAAIGLVSKAWQGEILFVQVGKWTAPIGITLVADLLSSIMVLITSVIGLVIFFYAGGTLDKARREFGFYPLTLFLIFGIMGSFLTGDVFNLYVWFEVMLMASFVLITLGGKKAQLEGAIKYVSINFLASSIFLAGVGVLYGTTGTLNMADLAVKLPQVNNSGLVLLAAVFFIICFGIKAAIFPLYFWLPASYHTPPIAIASLIAGLLTKVGVYALIRFFTLIFTADTGFTHTVLLYAAACTMVFGVLGAIIQNDFRKILSFHIISQIGYMILGLALYTPLAIAGAIFYIIHHILVKTNLFLLSGVSHLINRSYDLKKLGGLYRRFPVVSLCFAVSAFSLVGIPPLSGFWGKFMIAQAGLGTGDYWVVFLVMAVSMLTLFSMTKIWSEAFLKEREADNPVPMLSRKEFVKANLPVLLSVMAMCVLILFVGLNPEPLVDFSKRAAVQLLDTQGYIQAVLGKQSTVNSDLLKVNSLN